MSSVLALMTAALGFSLGILLPALLFNCIYKNWRFRYNENTLSYLGNYYTSRSLFQKSMLGFAGIHAAFLILLLIQFSFHTSIVFIALVILSAVCMMLIPLTTHQFKVRKTKRIIHNIAGGVFFFSNFIFIILFQIRMLQISRVVGVLGLVIAIIMFAGFIHYGLNGKLGRKGLSSNQELFYTIMISFWILLASLAVMLV